MKNRVRIQPYISADLRQRLAAYSGAQGLTESAVAEAALAEYLAPERASEPLVLRRLDGVGQVLERLEERVEVVGEAIGRLFRFTFATKEPQVSPKARSEADELYRKLVVNVAEAVATGATFPASVRRARLGLAAPASGSVAGAGR
jgi:hypothetical protein